MARGKKPAQKMVDIGVSKQYALEVERRHVAQLERMLNEESASKTKFQRYAIAVGTHLEQIAAAANAAHQKGLTFAKSNEPIAASPGSAKPSPATDDEAPPAQV